MNMSCQRYFAVIHLSLMLIVLVSEGFAAEQATAKPIDFVQLREYAIHAKAAYQTVAEIDTHSKLKHYTLSRYRTIPELDVTYYLLTNDATRRQILIVRGTSNVQNVLVNIDFKLMLDQRTSVRLHTGFTRAAEKIYDEIKPWLNRDYAISTGGHSLGGAVALIVAMYLDAEQYRISRVITFGQPKITNIAGAAKFAHLNIIRVVMPRDLVPLVPLLDPLDLNDLDIYWHVGKEVILLPGTHYAILEGVDSMLRATRFTQEFLSEDNLADHQMSLYISTLSDKIPKATQVPFKTDFNLFNLFGTQ